MESIPLFTITSSLHNAEALNAADQQFLSAIENQGVHFEHHGADYELLGQFPQCVLYVRTGGTESIFKQIFTKINGEILLLTSGHNNSLAASMEILAFLNQQGRRGEILHGAADHIAQRLQQQCCLPLQGGRIGVIGHPSDWLIASEPDVQALHDKLGITLVDIPIISIIDKVVKLRAEGRHYPVQHQNVTEQFAATYQDALNIYTAIQEVVLQHRLDAVTIRCFDLLGTLGNTGCLALAMLNAEGIPASCEGDIPALVTMMIAQQLTGVTGFQANPATINQEEMLFAHCTVPFNMVRDYHFDTHFESGIGIAIVGELPEGPVTMFKVAGDLSRYFVAEGTLLRNQHEANLCRTQVVLQMNEPPVADYFFKNPIGNHHIILPGHHRAIIEAALAKCGIEKHTI